MVVELAAVRLLAPWFGASLIVWTNVIAAVLLALALGYLWGGRLAARRDPLLVLSWMLCGAGATVAWVPPACGALARWRLPDEIGLEEAAPLVGWGSLAVALLVFMPPAALLGTVCPLVTEVLARGGGVSAGRAGGAVLCVSTLGSLAGVFGTSHLLLPRLGLRGSFLLAAGALFVAAALAGVAARVSRASRAGASALLLLGLSARLTPAMHPEVSQGLAELASRESQYQSLRVVEDRRSADVLRYLLVNEGFDSFQSVWQGKVGLLPEGFYYNDFLLPLSWTEPKSPWTVLVLGFGAGTVARVLQGEPDLDARVLGIEIDPGVVELGRSFFDLGSGAKALEVRDSLDARVALNLAGRQFDQVVLDCYANQIEIPPHLCTLEFFREVRERLSPGGWLTANLGGFDFSDPVVDAVSQTCARAFDNGVLLVRVPHSRNYMLLARREAALPWEGDALAAPTRRSSLTLGPRRLPGFARRVVADHPGLLLTDDRPRIEALQLRSIVEARSRRLAARP